MVKKILGIGLAIPLVVVLGGAIAMLASGPEGPPEGSPSAQRLAPGPYAVASIDHTFVDASRTTNANGDAAEQPTRSLVSTIWYPVDLEGWHPLVIYSHGFMSFRHEADYIARALASRGYVVVSADYPLTHYGTPGGPNVDDFIHQPADVSFLIDSMLQWVGDDRPFAGRIDADRIGVVGLSLGGLTSTLVTYHPRLRDPRVRASISIAGPMRFFSKRFFRTTDVPFLMVAGTIDAMVDYEDNALLVPHRVATGTLVTVRGASHAGFAAMADPAFRLMDNPDSIGCWALLRNLDTDTDEEPPLFAELGGEADGIDTGAEFSLPCQDMPLPEAMHAGRQHMVTQLAVVDFFESYFASEASDRQSAGAHLLQQLAKDFPEATVQLYVGGGGS